MTNSVRIATSAPGATQAASEVEQLRARFEKLQQSGAKFNAQGGLAAGIGAAVALKAISLVGNATGDLVGFAKDAANAYIEDEQSISRLNQALQQNIPNWNGQTQAIEGAVKAGEDLGFNADEQRNSIAQLVGATHNEAEALQILSVAEDLARARGISLAEASTALTTIDAGRARGLATLGINVKDYATTAERLAAVEQVVGGQAAAYADTLGGKVVVAQTKAHEAEVKMGQGFAELEATILPAVADGLVTVTDALDKFGHAGQIDQITQNVTGVTKARTAQEMADAKAAIEHGIQQINGLDFGPLALFGQGQIDEARNSLLGELGALVDTQRSFDLAGKIADDIAQGAPKVAAGIDTGIIVPLQEGVETARKQTVDSIRQWPRNIHDALVAGQSQVDSGMQELLNAEKHPISRAKRIAELESELTGKAIAKGLHSADPFVRTAAQDEMTNIRQQLQKLEQDAPGYGRRTGEAYAKALDSTVGYVQGAEGRGRTQTTMLVDGRAPTVVVNVNGVVSLTPGAARELADKLVPYITREMQRRGTVARHA